MSKVKNALMDYCGEHRLAYNFINEGSSIHFLIDSDDFHEGGISDIIGESTEIETDFKKVETLDNNMKQIVLKRMSSNP